MVNTRHNKQLATKVVKIPEGKTLDMKKTYMSTKEEAKKAMKRYGKTK